MPRPLLSELLNYSHCGEMALHLISTIHCSAIKFHVPFKISNFLCMGEGDKSSFHNGSYSYSDGLTIISLLDSCSYALVTYFYKSSFCSMDHT